MQNEHLKNVLTSLMILSFLIFGGLSAILLITDAPLIGSTVALPFAFLYISMMTLVVTAQISDRPSKTERFLRDWLLMVSFGVVFCAFVLAFA
ncbi:MAG: conserved membrane protein of unknown function [Candidatus Thorarchaeota archaeon]|nr:MAG: conserved membrane protein of unknown function [Candidatus Thorarchaeota archaeon]